MEGFDVEDNGHDIELKPKPRAQIGTLDEIGEKQRVCYSNRALIPLSRG